MIFKVFNEMFTRFEDLRIGVITLKNIDNSVYNNKVKEMIDEVNRYIKLNYTKDILTEKSIDPKARMISTWQSLYLDKGTALSEKKTNIINLMKKVFSGRKFPETNLLNDLCIYISLKYIVPINIFDLNKINGDLFLGFATGEEKYGDKFVNVNEVIYFDTDGAMSRNWNMANSMEKSTDSNTIKTIILVDALQVIDNKTLLCILDEFKSLSNLFFNCEYEQYIVNKKNPEIMF